MKIKLFVVKSEIISVIILVSLHFFSGIYLIALSGTIVFSETFKIIFSDHPTWHFNSIGILWKNVLRLLQVGGWAKSYYYSRYTAVIPLHQIVMPCLCWLRWVKTSHWSRDKRLASHWPRQGGEVRLGKVFYFEKEIAVYQIILGTCVFP